MGMVNITRHGVVLESTSHKFEDQAVLNPACITVNGITHMFYRAVHKGNFSSVGYCQLKDGKVTYRKPEPLIRPERAYESHGIEDPRIVQCDGIYHLFYTVFDGLDAQVAYSTATELPHFRRRGLISPKITYKELARRCEVLASTGNCFNYFCQHYEPNKNNGGETLLWEKDTFIFPQKIGGRYAMLHRIKPEIQLMYFDSFSDLTNAYWVGHIADLESSTLIRKRYPFENGYVGGGAPPLLTDAGWLLIYHAVEVTVDGNVYRAAAALLDRDHPERILGRLPYPLISPETEYERQGDVGNVVFPTSIEAEGDVLSIWYGAADKRIARASCSLNELLTELLANPAWNTNPPIPNAEPSRGVTSASAHRPHFRTLAKSST